MLPTPTALPINPPMITLNPDNFRIWGFTDEAIHLWHSYPSLGTAMQVAIIIMMVVVFVALMIRLVQSMSDEE